jgi:hypothetical protein
MLLVHRGTGEETAGSSLNMQYDRDISERFVAFLNPSESLFKTLEFVLCKDVL